MEESTARNLTAQPTFEPRILSILRWTSSILCFLYILGLLPAVNNPDRIPNDYATMLHWLFTAGLVIYLFVPLFKKRLKQWFFPAALAALAVIPIVNTYAANWLYLRQQPVTGAELLHAGQLYVWIIIALLLVSTHYGVRVILLFSGGTSLLAMLLAYWQQLAFGTDLAPTVQGVGGWLTVFLFAGYYAHQLTKSMRQQQVALAGQNAQLADYANTIEQLTVTRERNRLARELHDTLAHTLSAVEMQLKALDILIQRNPDAARRHLAETRALTRNGLQEARQALHGLRVRPVEEFGLLLALERLAQQAARRTEALPSVILPSQLSGVPAYVEQQLYRIAEEAVNNVVRHANATRFRLEVSLSAPPLPGAPQEMAPQATVARLRMTVQDDGVGFDPHLLPKGRYGLNGIRERAALIDAALTIDSAPGAGSRIEVIWEHKR